MQDPVELHEVCTGPLLMPVKLPLDGIPSLKCIQHFIPALNHNMIGNFLDFFDFFLKLLRSLSVLRLLHNGGFMLQGPELHIFIHMLYFSCSDRIIHRRWVPV